MAILAAAAALAAEGVQTFAEMRVRHYAIQARTDAVSPISYRAPLPALHALLAGDAVRAVVRADSADGDALCALAVAPESRGVQWLALSPAVPGCLAAQVTRGGSTEKRELANARWLVMDGAGAALYSRSHLPTAADLREIAALLAPVTRSAEVEP